jgi:hypothetical protein
MKLVTSDTAVSTPKAPHWFVRLIMLGEFVIKGRTLMQGSGKAKMAFRLLLE